METTNLPPVPTPVTPQYQPIKKKNKLFMILGGVLVAILVLAGIFLFWKPHLQVTAKIQDKKDAYKLGDTVTVVIEIKNPSFRPFKMKFGSIDRDPNLNIEGVKQKLHLIASPGDDFSHGEILGPFWSKTFTAKINLVNEKSWVNDAGMMYNYDLIVQPGKNTITVRWFNETSIDIFIDSKSFYEDKIDCKLFSDAARKNQCAYDFTEGGVENIESCRAIVGDDFLKENCFSDLAMQKKDSSICNELEGEHKDYCIGDVYFETKDPKYCKEMSDPTSCYSAYASDGKDPSYCELISDVEKRDYCYSNVIDYSVKDYKLCAKISDKGRKTSCYSRTCKKAEASLQPQCYEYFAVDVSNTFFCNKILDKDKSRQCYKAVYEKMDIENSVKTPAYKVQR